MDTDVPVICLAVCRLCPSHIEVISKEKHLLYLVSTSPEDRCHCEDDLDLCMYKFLFCHRSIDQTFKASGFADLSPVCPIYIVV